MTTKQKMEEVFGKQLYGPEEFFDLVYKMIDICSRKNQDYSGGVDPLANLKACSNLGVAPWLGALIRLQDKQARIVNLAKNSEQRGAVVDESIEDTLIDQAVYSLLAIVLLRQDDGAK